MAEIFIIKNVSAGSIELKDFGAIISPNETTELGNSDRASLSTELNTYLQNGTLVRLISGSTVNSSDAYTKVLDDLKVSDVTTTGTTLPYAQIDTVNGNKLVTSGGYFGQKHQRALSTGSTANSATVTTPVLSGTTENLPAGTYKFTVSWLWSRSATGNYGMNTFLVDGTAQGTRTIAYMRSVATTDIYPDIRVFHVTFATATTHTYSFNVYNNAGTTTVSDIIVEVIRVI